MQFESFHWLSHHRLCPIIPCYTNMVSVRTVLSQFSFQQFRGVFNKTIISLALVGYEMITANSSYPTPALEVIVKYAITQLSQLWPFHADRNQKLPYVNLLLLKKIVLGLVNTSTQIVYEMHYRLQEKYFVKMC